MIGKGGGGVAGGVAERGGGIPTHTRHQPVRHHRLGPRGHSSNEQTFCLFHVILYILDAGVTRKVSAPVIGEGAVPAQIEELGQQVKKIFLSSEKITSDLLVKEKLFQITQYFIFIFR